MSNNDLSLQGEAANPAATSNQPPSSSSLQSATPASGPHGACRGPPPRPVFSSPYSNGLPPSAQRITWRALAEVVFSEGVEAAAWKARQHHLAVRPANAPSVAALISRNDGARCHFGTEEFDEFRQGSPKAVALRLLAPPAGPSYEFEQVETPYTNQKGKVTTGKKCGAPGCEYRNHQDHRRHMAEMHVKDPVKAFFCPDGDGDGDCEKAYYDSSRRSEMKNHIKGHENRGNGAQRKGRGNQGGPAQ